MSLEQINPAPLGEPHGWTNGMLAPSGGRVLCVAGQTARDTAGRIVKGGLVDQWEQALAHWKSLPSDPGAKYDRVLVFHAKDITPQVTWGTNPGQVIPVTGKVPTPADFTSDEDKKTAQRSLEYMGLDGGTPIFVMADQFVL